MSVLWSEIAGSTGEAKLFLSLLDEKFGEDEQVFMLHCYRVLDVLLGGRLNWGPLRDKVSYEIFAQEYALLFPEKSTKTGGYLLRVEFLKLSGYRRITPHSLRV